MSTQGQTVGSAAGDRAAHWFNQHRRQLTIGAAAIFLVSGGIWFTRSAQERKEAFAARELSQARSALEAGNLRLASSDLGRIIDTFSGTAAGEEAVLLLANAQLQQGQPALAVTALREFLNRSPRSHFEGPAAGLLGAALEELGRFDEAADAYERAAEAVPYQMIRDQYRLDLGRAARLGGDPARAASAYEAILADSEDTQAAAEARVRLSEVMQAPLP